MYIESIKGTDCLRFSNLAACSGLAHGIFFRRQCLAGDKSFNVALTHGPDRRAAVQNRSIIKDCLNGKRLFSVNQVHGKNIVVLKKGMEKDTIGNEDICADAVISDIPMVDVMIMTADCQAVMLYDPALRVCANIHSGWRGSIQNIIAGTINAMKEHFGTDPAALLAGIGPSLGPCCAEFVNFKQELPSSFWHFHCPAPERVTIKTKNNGVPEKKIGQEKSGPCFNFWAASVDQLCSAGVLRENIETSGICTRCNPHLFFSYRKSGTSMRFANVIGIRTS